MIDRTQIPYANWSLRVGRADPKTGELRDTLGEIVFAIDDLDQSIANIILTPLGSVPINPLKGCDIMPYIDQIPDILIPNLTREIWDAITIWVKRVVLQKVEVVMVGTAHFAARVFWRPSERILDDLRVTEVTYSAA